MWEIIITEKVKGNIIFFLAFLIPIFAYIGIGNRLGRAFEKTPDNPLFERKRKDGLPLKILKRLGLIALAFVIVFAKGQVSRKAILNVLEENEARDQAIAAEYEGSNEENIDPVNGKKILTQTFLRMEYKMYVANEVGGKNFASTLYKVIFIELLIVAGGLSCIEYAIEFILQKKRINFLSIFASVLLVPTIIFVFSTIDKQAGPPVLPDPDNAKLSVRTVTIDSRHDVVHRDDEYGTESYTYYITIDYGEGNGPVSREVGYDMYDTAEKPGTYLMGVAEEKDNRCDFRLFSMKEYEEEE